jgi:hypothetical protein
MGWEALIGDAQSSKRVAHYTVWQIVDTSAGEGSLPACGHPPPCRERDRATKAAEGDEPLCHWLWLWFPLSLQGDEDALWLWFPLSLQGGGGQGEGAVRLIVIIVAEY